MRCGAAIAGAALGLAAAGVAAYFLVPRIVAPSGPAPAPGARDAPRSAGRAPRSDIPVPLSDAERERQRLSEKRVPFFRDLRARWSHVVERFAVLDDQDTLVIVVTRVDEEFLRDLVEQAVAPTALSYGFRRVHLMAANPQDSAAPFRMLAEATCDDAGRWTVYPR